MNYRYAQTNVQLYNQLRELGYDESGLAMVAEAHELALRLLVGVHHPCGKPLLAHHVGVASILVDLRLPSHVVAAGMLHAVYKHGDFGSFSKGSAPANRRRVRTTVGEDVEEIVFVYTGSIQWPPRGGDAATTAAAALEGVERYAYLMQIVNALEDHLDLGIRYCEEFSLASYFEGEGLEQIASVCERMGYPGLAKLWREVVSACTAASVPESLRQRSRRATKHAPESYRPQLMARARTAFDRIVGLLR